MINISNNDIEIIHGPELKGDVEMSQADIEFTKQVLNWTYEINLEKGLTELIKNKNVI